MRMGTLLVALAQYQETKYQETNLAFLCPQKRKVVTQGQEPLIFREIRQKPLSLELG
jgi:hypothetical protein